MYLHFPTLLVCLVSTVVASHPDYPFWNVSLPWDDRVDDLVNRLTLDELVTTLAGGGGRKRSGKIACNPAIPRLGIKPYNFFTVCFYGVTQQRSTIFPQSIGLAATFSPDTIEEVATIISTEARAINNNATKYGVYDLNNIAVTCMAPFINIMHHPLWGRVQEIYGEDPFLSSVMAQAFIRGLRGNHTRYVRASSACLAIDAYSGPENIPSLRFNFKAVISERDLRLTFLPAYRACAEEDAFGLMCSYNSVNGVPMCANKRILTDIMRNEYGFKGFVITDASAVEYISDRHKYTKSHFEDAVAAVNAGVNLELQPIGTLEEPYGAFGLLGTAVEKGLVSFDTMVERAKPLFYTRMRQGEFDPPEMNPYTKIDTSVLQSPQHREKAIEVTTKSFVLMKNNHRILPIQIKEKLRSLAVIGPFANNAESLFGDYCPDVQLKYVSTPATGLSNLTYDLRSAAGCDDSWCHHYNQTEVKTAVTGGSGAELVVVCLGTGNLVETEGHDRANLDLPGQQLVLLQDVTNWAQGVPVILLVFSAGPVDIRWAQSSPLVSAIIQCFFPGQSAGEALRRVLAVTDDQVVSPAGRLPYTWPMSMEQVPSVLNFSMEGRTYRYFEGEPLYPYGYGLSYSSFKYTRLQVSPSVVQHGSDVTITTLVENIGVYDSDEVIQLYLSWVDCPVHMPNRQLVGVTRRYIVTGNKVKVIFKVTPEQMKIWDDVDGFVYHYGVYGVTVGGSQPNQTRTTGSNILYGSFTLV